MQTPLDQKYTIELSKIIELFAARLNGLEETISANQQTINTLREREETYRILLDESSDPIFSFIPDGTYRYVNLAFADGVGRKLEEIINYKIWDVFSQDEADKRYTVVHWVFANGESRVIEVRVPRPDGDRYYITTVKPIKNEQDEVLSVICISKEITERKLMEEELRRLSTYDLLTDLYNRNFFETEIQRVRTNGSFPVSIVMVDVDNLKTINDTLGHAEGDEMIRRTARVLRDSFRSEDIIARFGGDEFIVLLRGIGEPLLGDIIQRLYLNVEKENIPDFSLSVGYASGNENCELNEVIRQADNNMYADKAARAEMRKSSPSGQSVSDLLNTSKGKIPNTLDRSI